jgi:hypothetical protein
MLPQWIHELPHRGWRVTSRLNRVLVFARHCLLRGTDGPRASADGVGWRVTRRDLRPASRHFCQLIQLTARKGRRVTAAPSRPLWPSGRAATYAAEFARPSESAADLLCADRAPSASGARADKRPRRKSAAYLRLPDGDETKTNRHSTSAEEEEIVASSLNRAALSHQSEFRIRSATQLHQVVHFWRAEAGRFQRAPQPS